MRWRVILLTAMKNDKLLNKTKLAMNIEKESIEYGLMKITDSLKKQPHITISLHLTLHPLDWRVAAYFRKRYWYISLIFLKFYFEIYNEIYPTELTDEMASYII